MKHYQRRRRLSSSKGCGDTRILLMAENLPQAGQPVCVLRFRFQALISRVPEKCFLSKDCGQIDIFVLLVLFLQNSEFLLLESWSLNFKKILHCRRGANWSGYTCCYCFLMPLVAASGYDSLTVSTCQGCAADSASLFLLIPERAVM